MAHPVEYLSRDALRALANAWMWSKLLGKDVHASRNSIEPDKRKQRKVIERCIDDGLVVADGEWMLVATDKLAKSIGSSAPELRGPGSVGYPGATVESLAAVELIWVGENPRAVSFTRADCGREVYVPDIRADQDGRGRHGTLCVAPDYWLAERVHGQWAERVENLMAQNLANGLHELRVLSENEARQLDKIGVFGHIGGFCLPSHESPDPANWGDKLHDATHEALETLLTIHARLTLFRKIEKGVALYGGWDAFRASLRKLCADALHKQEAEAVRDAQDNRKLARKAGGK